VTDPADLGVLDAAHGLRDRRLSSRELVSACLARIADRDGEHTFDGDAVSINAWVRVYEEDALAAADRADERLAAGDAPLLCGVPVGLKDLYGVAEESLTASSRVLKSFPRRSCDVWGRLEAAGMVLLGHTHTHEFAAGGTTDQVGNPWALERSAGGSSGGSAAALASRTTPAATGTDTAGSLRIPSAYCGTATIKPTRGLVPMKGIVPLAPSLDHAGPMARDLADCVPLLAVMAEVEPPAKTPPLRRVALSPRFGELDPDVADGLDAAMDGIDALLVTPEPPGVSLDLGPAFLDLLCSEMLAYHRRFRGRRELYRPSTRGFLAHGERCGMTADDQLDVQLARAELTATWIDWLGEHRIDALVEPTVPIVARPRGHGYDVAFTDTAEVSLTHYWDWTGFPVVALPAGTGRRSGLPVGVSLIGPPGSDWRLLAAGAELQRRLPMPAPEALRAPSGASRSRRGADGDGRASP
jgi:aspartyl-tRNA(Asn)/glutamyl-tRNA(Gln) amidotransferase subunit A